MERYRKEWNERHKKLRHAFDSSTKFEDSIKLYLDHHASVHSAKMSKYKLHSFEDEILNGLSDDKIRCVFSKHNHSIAWILWHLARIEDVTMNLLVVDFDQILIRNDWSKKLEINFLHTGNGMSDTEIVKFSKQINIKALKAYRVAVGRRTQAIIKKIKPENLNDIVKPERIQKIWDQKAMLKNAKGIVNYWSKRTIAGLLLMPPTRHCFIHLNEAKQIKVRL